MTKDRSALSIASLPKPIVGVDEVGRGCLAGSVCAGAVILNSSVTHFYQDSKTLTACKRALWSDQIHKLHQVGIGFATEKEIDQINILQASLLAMKRAVLNLKIQSGTLLIDGKWVIPDFDFFKQIPIIKGDRKYHAIAAASIVAKHFRDQRLIQLSKKYPKYHFHQHKGYPTVQHQKAIQEFGPCEIHRRTFCGVKEYLKS